MRHTALLAGALCAASLILRSDAQCVNSPVGSLSATASSTIGTGSRPRGVAVDSTRGRIYIAEEGTNLLRATTLTGGAVWTRAVSGPWDAAVDPSTGRIFVTQYAARAVLAFDTNGNQVLAIGQTSRKNYGEPGFFNGPAGLAVTGSTLIVTDPENNRFQTFTTGGSLTGVYGKKGFGDGAFGGLRGGPYAVAVYDAGGQVYFADPVLDRVSRWSISGTSFAFQANFGTSGRNVGQLYSPFSVAVNPANGDVHVSSTNTFRVEVYSGCGDFRGTIGSTDSRSIAICSGTPAGETLFSSSTLPSLTHSIQFSFGGITVGLRFTVRTNGFITAIRYVKPTGDVNQHTMRLWNSATRAQLYSETMQIDGCPGRRWVRMALRTPVAVTTGTTYVASVDNLDQYCSTSSGFGSANTGSNVAITASTAGLTGANNGAFPATQSATNYWIDVEFQSNAAYVAPSGAGPQFGYAYGSTFATPGNGVLYVADTSSSLVRTFTVSTTSGGPAPAPVPTSPVPVPTAPVPAPTGGTSGQTCGTFPAASTNLQTIFKSTDTVATTSLTDGYPIVLGMRFTTNVAGTITSFRYYKAGGETDTTHTGNIYLSSTGALVATTGEFNDGSCSNAWVSAPLISPFTTSPGVEYTVAIDSVLNYVKNEGTLTAARTSGSLTAVAGGSVFSTTLGVVPRDTFGTSAQASYWVDVEFRSSTAPVPAPTAPVPVPTAPVPVPTAPVPLPTAPVPAPTGGTSGQTCGTFPAASTNLQTIFKSTDTVATTSLTDGYPIVLGLRFTTSVAGDITSFRYYKAGGETAATHTGNIYLSSTGARVATTGVFNDASCTAATGRWVSAPLTAPYRTSPGVEYTVAIDSVLNYVKNEGLLGAARVSGALTAVAGGSVFSTTLGVVPRDRFGTSAQACYWVDVEFRPATAPSPVPAPTAPAPVPTAPVPVPTAPVPVPTAPVPVPTSGTIGCNVFPTGTTQTLFTPANVPPTTSLNDGYPIVLGMQFTFAVAGRITGFRYYKAGTETTATHSGRVYLASSGALVGTTGTFNDASCTAAGGRWVSVPLQTPVTVTAATRYTVAIDSVTNYAKTDSYLSVARTRGDVTAVASGAVYGTTVGVIPRDFFGTSGQSNYWVDVEFVRS